MNVCVVVSASVSELSHPYFFMLLREGWFYFQTITSLIQNFTTYTVFVLSQNLDIVFKIIFLNVILVNRWVEKQDVCRTQGGRWLISRKLFDFHFHQISTWIPREDLVLDNALRHRQWGNVCWKNDGVQRLVDSVPMCTEAVLLTPVGPTFY